jgi:hypothetical protein
MLKVIVISGLCSNVKFLPLGYTNNFLEHIKFGNISLPLNKFSEPSYSTFYGVSGSFSRKNFLRHFERNGYNLQINTAWGGDKKNLTGQYINALTRGNLSLCPPGYSSNETFRYYESLFLGNLPIRLSFSLNSFIQQPDKLNFDHYNIESLKLLIEELSGKEIKELVSFQHEIFERFVAKVNDLISNFEKS